MVRFAPDPVRGGTDWWDTGCIHQIHLQSLTSAEPTHTVRSHLQELCDLGVDAVSLTVPPLLPTADCGLDTNVSGVLDTVVAEARNLGLRVLVDLDLGSTSGSQPEDNRAPDQAESLIRLWLDRGADGLRIVDAGDSAARGQDRIHEIPRGWLDILGSYPGRRIAVVDLRARTAHTPTGCARPAERRQVVIPYPLSLTWDAVDLRAAIDITLQANRTAGASNCWKLHGAPAVNAAPRSGDLRQAQASMLLALALPGAVFTSLGEQRRSASHDPSAKGAGGLRTSEPDPWVTLYAGALSLRGTCPALVGSDLVWTESPSGTLIFSRPPGFLCTVNTTDRGVPVDVPRHLLLASGPLASDPGTGSVILPPHTTAWWLQPHDRT